MLNGFRRHLFGYDSLSQEGSSIELAKEDDGANKNIPEVYFYKINDFYKLLKQLMVFLNEESEREANFIRCNFTSNL